MCTKDLCQPVDLMLPDRKQEGFLIYRHGNNIINKVLAMFHCIMKLQATEHISQQFGSLFFHVFWSSLMEKLTLAPEPNEPGKLCETVCFIIYYTTT